MLLRVLMTLASSETPPPDTEADDDVDVEFTHFGSAMASAFAALANASPSWETRYS